MYSSYFTITTTAATCVHSHSDKWLTPTVVVRFTVARQLYARAYAADRSSDWDNERNSCSSGDHSAGTVVLVLTVVMVKTERRHDLYSKGRAE